MLSVSSGVTLSVTCDVLRGDVTCKNGFGSSASENSVAPPWDETQEQLEFNRFLGEV